MNGYGFPAYSSTHPALADLFRNEMAQRTAGVQAAQATEAQRIAREQIAAQRQLAEAQLRATTQQQNMANLFKQEEFKARREEAKEDRRVREKEVDARKAWYEGSLAVKGGLSDEEADALDAEQETLAGQYNAALDSQREALKVKRDKDKKKELDELVTIGGFFDRTAKKKEIEDRYTALEQEQEGVLWSNLLQALRQDPSARLVESDPLNKRFRAKKAPRKNKATGTGAGSAAPPGSTPKPTEGGTPAASATEEGTKPTPAPTDLSEYFRKVHESIPAHMQPIPPGTPSAGPNAWATSPGAPIGGGTWSGGAPGPATAGPPYAAPATTPAPAVAQSAVRFEVPGVGTVEVSATDAADIDRQRQYIPAEQRRAAASQMLDQLLKSGRARVVAPNTGRVAPTQAPVIGPMPAPSFTPNAWAAGTTGGAYSGGTPAPVAPRVAAPVQSIELPQQTRQLQGLLQLEKRLQATEAATRGQLIRPDVSQDLIRVQREIGRLMRETPADLWPAELRSTNAIPSEMLFRPINAPGGYSPVPYSGPSGMGASQVSPFTVFPREWQYSTPDYSPLFGPGY